MDMFMINKIQHGDLPVKVNTTPLNVIKLEAL